MNLTGVGTKLPGRPKYLYLLFVAALLWVACGNPYGPVEEERVFRYNEPAGIQSLDPAYSRDLATIWITNQLFNGLVELDQDLEVKPALAKNWNISPNRLQYLFHLRDDCYFIEDVCFKGEKRKVTAHDFVFSLNRLRSEELASPGAWTMRMVKPGDSGIIALNDSTLLITLNEPFPAFLSILAMNYCSVVPEEAIEFYADKFRQHPVGTGPFKLAYWKEGIKMILRKNPDYFESSPGKPVPLMESVSISFLKDKQTAFLEFIKGDLDYLNGIEGTYRNELLLNNGLPNPKHENRIKMIRSPFLNTEYLGIRLGSDKSNFLQDARIRKAMAFSFDRQKMLQYLRNGIGSPAIGGFIPKGMPGHLGQDTLFAFKPEKAKALLSEAGHPNGAGLDALKLTTTADYLEFCQYLQSAWSEVGIPVEIEVSPAAAMREMRANGKLDFFRASWVADYADAENYLSLFYSQNASPAGPNYTHFQDAVFDSLYRHSFQIIKLSQRSMLYEEMDRHLMKQTPVILLYYDELVAFLQKNVHGFQTNPTNTLDLRYVWKEKVQL